MRSLCGITCLLFVSSGAANAGLMTLTNTTTGLFDASSGTRSVIINSSTPGWDVLPITRVEISIDFVKADGETFAGPYPAGTPYLNETVFTLTGPGGTVNLISAISFKVGTTLFDGVIHFAQSAPQVVNVVDTLMQAGTFQPVGNLGTFNGQLAAATWTLNIQDTTAADALRFRSFTLTVETAGVPEPSSAAMLVIAGLLTTAGAMRRRSKNGEIAHQ